jgi:hypothetical protein
MEGSRQLAAARKYVSPWAAAVKNIVAAPLLLVAGCLFAGAFGAIHDQISYTVSPEYFTAFKFHQFRIDAAVRNRFGAAVVGWLASWWMGPIIAPPILLVAYLCCRQQFVRSSLQAFGVVTITTLLMGCGALLFASLRWTADDFAFISIPADVLDRDAFIHVGIMHTFSYLGGVVGIVTAICFLIVRRKKRAG